MYIKYKDYNGQALGVDDSILMSKAEFDSGGSELLNLPVTVTLDGNEPVQIDDYLPEVGAVESIPMKSTEERLAEVETEVDEITELLNEVII